MLNAIGAPHAFEEAFCDMAIESHTTSCHQIILNIRSNTMEYENTNIDDTQTIKLRAYELGIGSECSHGALEKCTWFFGLYLSSVFVLTAIGVCIRWLLASL